jgi:hypothetical protein
MRTTIGSLAPASSATSPPFERHRARHWRSSLSMIDRTVLPLRSRPLGEAIPIAFPSRRNLVSALLLRDDHHHGMITGMTMTRRS